MYENGVKILLHKCAVLYQSKCMYFDVGIKVTVAHGLKFLTVNASICVVAFTVNSTKRV